MSVNCNSVIVKGILESDIGIHLAEETEVTICIKRI